MKQEERNPGQHALRYILRVEENAVRGSWELGRVEVTYFCHTVLSMFECPFPKCMDYVFYAFLL